MQYAIGVRNTFRVGDDDAWQQQVEALVRIVQVIVIDVRTLTNPVEYEFSHLCDTDMMYKVLCICSPLHSRTGSEQFIYDQVADKPRCRNFVMLPEGEALRLLFIIRNDRSARPTCEKTILEVCKEYQL
jgi:hypothetical protein